MAVVRLRPYQEDAVNAVITALRSGKRRMILQAPVGAGKTIMAARLIHRLGCKTIVTAHRIELLAQMEAHLRHIRLSAGQVSVASIQELANGRHQDAGLIVIDECHRTEAASYKKLIANNPHALVVGLTATPQRLDGLSLLAEYGGTYDGIVEAASIQRLAVLGHILIPQIYSSPTAPDIAGVKINRKTGDYDGVALEKRLRKSRLYGDLVEHYKRLGKKRQAVVFAQGVEHASDIAKRFIAANVSAKAVFGHMPHAERTAILNDFKRRRFRILVNVDICVEGWDYPALNCVILATPTRSRVKYIQAIGRAMRNAEGKPTPIVLDHGGCAHFHGVPEDPYDYAPSAKQAYKGRASRHCNVCGRILAQNAVQCPCGTGLPRVLDKQPGEVPCDLTLFGKAATKTDKVILEKIAARSVQMGNGCIEWRGPTLRTVPHLRVSTGGGTAKKVSLQVRAWLGKRAGIDIPVTRVVDVTCGNKKCINTHHIEANSVDVRIARHSERMRNGCLKWHGPVFSSNGAAMLVVCGDGKTTLSVRRFLMEKHLGHALRHGQVLENTCKTLQCIEPTHMKLGSSGGNLRLKGKKKHGAAA